MFTATRSAAAPFAVALAASLTTTATRCPAKYVIASRARSAPTSASNARTVLSSSRIKAARTHHGLTLDDLDQLLRIGTIYVQPLAAEQPMNAEIPNGARGQLPVVRPHH